MNADLYDETGVMTAQSLLKKRTLERDGIRTSELWLSLITILTVLLIGTILLWFNRIESQDWVTLAKWVPASLASAYSISRGVMKGLTNLSR